MKILVIFLLAVGCNTGSDFSTAASGDDATSGAGDLLAATIIAEGMNYTGDPIVLKEPPGDNFSLYTKISSKWRTKVVTTAEGSHELNGTTRSERVSIASLVATRQNVQSVSQISREPRLFTRRQPGQQSDSARERFTQANRGILDILLAIDNSGSMGQEISQVKNNLSSLLSHIGNSNWQIGLVKSDPYTMCAVEGRITSTGSSAADNAAYTRLLTFPLQGGNEHMLKKVRWALEGKGGTGCDGRWLRSGSTVAVIVISDEPHQCPAQYADPNFCSTSAYRNFVNAFGRNLKTYGFTAWSDADKQAIFTQHGSVTGNYSAVLQRISADIQVNLQDIFTLSARPDGVQMTVQVNNSAIPSCSATQTKNCYKVVTAAHGSAVQFIGYKPPRNASIAIDYTYGGVGFETEWTLPHEPLADAAQMTVTVNKADGTSTALVHGTDYSLSGRVLRVTSADLVPQGATLRVDYLENRALQTAFTLSEASGRLPNGATLVPETVEVHLSDGSSRTIIKTIARGFNFDGTTLTFTDNSQVPAAGISGTTPAQKFTIAYNYRHGKKTSYSFSRHDDHRPDIPLSCHNDTRDNAVTCANDDSADTITFSDTAQFAVGDEIVISEQLLQQDNNLSLRGTGWLADEAVEVELSGKGSCTILPSFIVDDTVMLETMTAAECAFMQYLHPDRKQMVGYTYRVYAPDAEDFLQMDKGFFANHYGKYKFEYWEVLINDTRTEKFTVEDRRVVFAKEVDIGKNSKVGITVYLYHAL